MVHDVVIVGSGPAGYTAAIYAARAQLKPVLVAGAVTAGGALMNTTEVENFPGFPEGIQGPDLMNNMMEQAEKFGTDIRYEDVVKLELAGEVKRVHLEDEVLETRTVIFSTGSAYRKLGLEEEDKYSGHGVSYCATCDGFFFRDQDIIVVGGGDSAMEEATFLTTFAKSVTVVHRRDELRASAAMAKRALENPKINFAWNSRVSALHGEGALESVTLTDTVTGQTRELEATGLFVAIGSSPRSGWCVTSWSWMPPAMWWFLTPPPALTSPVSLLAATSQTPPTVRPSLLPPRAPAPLWTPSTTWLN